MADESSTRYAIVQWEDNLTSIINLQSVKYPRKPITHYLEGDYITAPYGRRLYKARISEICGDRIYLMKKTTLDGQFPLQYLFEEEEMVVSQDKQSTPTASGQFEADDIARKSKTLMPEKQTLTSTLVLQKSTHLETATAGSSSSDVSDPNVPTPTAPSPADTSDTQVLTVPSPADTSDTQVLTVPSPADTSDTQVLTVPSPAQSPVGSNSSKRRLDHLEREVKELRSSVKAMKKRVKELEEKSTNTPGGSSSPSVSASESDDVFLAEVSHLSATNEKDVNSIVKRLALKMFTREELTTHTRTGKKTTKTGEVPKPPLDDGKLQSLERLVLTKCPSLTPEIFKKKIDNIIKMERRAKGKK